YFTAENAELDGIEGKSYVFTAEEIRAVLGEDAESFLDWHQLADLPESRIDHELPDGGAVNLAVGRAYDAFEQGGLAESIAGFEPEYAALLEARQARGLPKRDRKQVAEFNALTGLGLLAAAQPIDRGDWQERAQAVGDWLWARLWDADEQHLYRQAYEGEVSGEAFLSDHAAAGRLMLALYGSSHDIRWLFRAQRIAATIEREYLDESGRLHERPPESGGGLPLSPPLVGDDASPSGHSQAVVFLLDLGAVLNDPTRQERAVRALAGFAAEVDAAPADWGFLVGALARPSRAEVVTREAAQLAEATETIGGPGETRDHVEVEARAAEGGEVIVVRLAIDEGFHINANPASEDFLVPTRVTALDGEIGSIDYPSGKPFRAEFARSAIDVYEGVLELRVPVTGEMPTRLRLDLQACDDRVCLAPDEVEVAVDRVGE
uniref:protein-disulfide reductase DsbD domain-containing protein n=1 Tax=Guyparkeria sp. TaxID=2035736 RepID=UPI003563C840